MSSKKYLIDLDEHIQSVISIGVTDSGNVYTIGAYKNELKGLNSYAESEYQRGLNDGSLDVKQRVEGAYQRGYDEGYNEGYKKCLSENDFDQPCISCDGYKRGLDDAWEAARRIVVDTDHGGLALGTLSEIFGTQSYSYIMRENAAQEAIDKIKAYEGKHSDRIEVGDIVERYIDGKLDSKGIYLQEDGDYWRCLFDTGAVLMTFAYPKGQFKKTGKHYDIASILEAMRNEG